MTEGSEQERPDLEAVLSSLLFCVLSPGALCAASEEFISCLLLNAVGKGLMEGLHYGLSGLVPGAGLFLREWEDQGILRRGPHDEGFSLTDNGVDVIRAKLMSPNYLKHRSHLDLITRTVLNESMETLLSQPVAHTLFEGARLRPGMGSA